MSEPPVRKPRTPPPNPSALPAPPDVAAPPADARTSPSGLASKVLVKGTGSAHPGPHDRVTLSYTGWTAAGAMFDSSVARGIPSTMSLDAVLAGWAEGIQTMVKGETARFWIPPKLGYGDIKSNGAPKGPIVFDIELVDFAKTPVPKAPAELKEAPKSATRTSSGLAYKILQHGPARGAHPTPKSFVDVYYAGWTPDGQLFDSSLVRGQPSSLLVLAVVKGWQEALRMMVPGDKVRLWVPADLAYGTTRASLPGTPTGPLVYDLELAGIKDFSAATAAR